jgi:dihydroflavonol-4-reductase
MPPPGNPTGTERRRDGSAKIAFVTGATGFLGLNLIAELASEGFDIVALHRSASDLTHLRRFPVRLAIGTVEDPAALERAMPEEVDFVFHAAADTSLWARNTAQLRINVEGTRNVVAAALRRGAKKFVHTSSSTVYGFAAPHFDETAPHAGRTARFNYMRTKALAEDEVRLGLAKGLDAVFLNPAVVIGRFDRNNWSRLVRLAAEGRLPRIPPGRASFAHAADVARAHVAAARRGRSGENYLLGGVDASYRQVVTIVAELAGRTVDAGMVSGPILRLTGRALDWVSGLTGTEPSLTAEAAAYLSANLTCRSDKAISELGYRPAPLRAMLEDCYRWLIEEAMIRPAR